MDIRVIDEENNLYYLNSRYYDPEVSRFISMDSIEYIDPDSLNGLNLYAYCNNNPIMNVDPSGNSWSSFWKGLGVAILAVVAVVAVSALVACYRWNGGSSTWSFGNNSK